MPPALSGDVTNTLFIFNPAARKRPLASREGLTISPPHSKRRKTDAAVEPTKSELQIRSKVGVIVPRSTVDLGIPALLNPLPCSRLRTCPAHHLFFWGAGDDGQFGTGKATLDEVGKPECNVWVGQQIQKGTFGGAGAGLEAIAAGGLHTLFLDEKGTVWSCGSHDGAALGRTIVDVLVSEHEAGLVNVENLTSTPHPVQSLVDEKFRVVKIATGDNICAVLNNSGGLRIWGSLRDLEGSETFYNLPTSILQLPSEEKLSDVACGVNHLVMLTTHGNIYTWGLGERGQLGVVIRNNETHEVAIRPQKVALPIRSRRSAVIGTGDCHSFAVDDHGDVWGWGLNAHGQTGTGLSDVKADSVVPSPKKVVGLSKDELGGQKVIQVTGGEFHSVFLVEDGRVFACGRTVGGELGLGKDCKVFKDRLFRDCLPTPTQIFFPDSDDRVIRIEAGARRSMAITEGGVLYCWGEGHQSELGLGTDIEQVDEPTVVAAAVVAVSCGGQHTLALFRQ